MGITDEHKIRRQVREEYNKEAIKMAGIARKEIDEVLIRFQNRAFNLAIKHTQTIKEILDEYKSDKENEK